MKRRIAGMAALLLLLVSLAGCGTDAGEVRAETTAPLPEATAPAATEENLPLPETEAPAEEPVPFTVTITPVITEAQTQVIVTTADEFLAAIAPNTEVLLDADLIDLSEATGYGREDGEYYCWGEEFDGPELRIRNVTNLTIRGTGEDHGENVISSVPRYAHVLAFENCGNIHIVGFTAGHTKEPGSCTGGVLCFRNCQEILVEDCGLYGCGTVGVTGESSRDMQIVNNEIYECSVGGVELTSCDGVNVDGNCFRDLGGAVFRLYDCGSVTCNGEDAVPFR